LLAEKIQLAEEGLAQRVKMVLEALNLPTKIPPSFDINDLLKAMQNDKKRKDGVIRFSLPVKVGEVKTGVIIDDLGLIRQVLGEL
ncbi:MAG: 3-dehydroquinate synthase, partial [Anaerolineales bacterium]